MPVGLAPKPVICWIVAPYAPPAWTHSAAATTAAAQRGRAVAELRQPIWGFMATAQGRRQPPIFSDPSVRYHAGPAPS